MRACRARNPLLVQTRGGCCTFTTEETSRRVPVADWREAQRVLLFPGRSAMWEPPGLGQQSMLCQTGTLTSEPLDTMGMPVDAMGDRKKKEDRHAVDALASSAEEGRG